MTSNDPTLRTAIALIVGGLAILGIRSLRAQDENFVPPPKSTETARVEVEHAMDSDAGKVDRSEQPLGIDEMLALAQPGDLSDRRVAPFETHVWKLHALVTQIQVRDDGDFYLVVKADGRESCVEAPDPKLCPGSPLIDPIRQVRTQLEQDLHPQRAPKKVDRWADIEGIGFFGTAPRGSNGARLMPLTAIRWTTR